MNVLDQLRMIFAADGIEAQRVDGQLGFGVQCGVFPSLVSAFQNGWLLVLMVDTGFSVPDERRGAVAEFCTSANYEVSTYANLEKYPDSQIHLRRALFLQRRAPWPRSSSAGSSDRPSKRRQQSRAQFWKWQ